MDDGKQVVATLESQLSFREKIDLRESELRQRIASDIMRTFLWINSAVFLFIVFGFISDIIFIARGLLPNDSRIIDAKVIISIVGATTIQLGAISFSLSQWLFPKISRKEIESMSKGSRKTDTSQR